MLAASAPLSLQAHPTPEQAEAGFARENAAGIPLDAPNRNYKDPFHKPELIYALSDPFRALSGFRPVAETRRVLEVVSWDERIAPLLDRLDDDDSLRPVFEWLITRGRGVDELVAALVEASAELDDVSWDTVRLLADHYPGDPGIAISLLLHTVVLKPRRGALPAGRQHPRLPRRASASSSWPRPTTCCAAGSRPKHVDVPELLVGARLPAAAGALPRAARAASRASRSSGRTCPISS